MLAYAVESAYWPPQKCEQNPSCCLSPGGVIWKLNGKDGHEVELGYNWKVQILISSIIVSGVVGG